MLFNVIREYMYFVWSFYAISNTTINWGTNPSPLGIWMVSIRFDLRKHFEINIFHSLTDHSHRVFFNLKIFEWWLKFWTVSAVQNPLELCLYILTCIFLVKYYCDIIMHCCAKLWIVKSFSYFYHICIHHDTNRLYYILPKWPLF